VLEELAVAVALEAAVALVVAALVVAGLASAVPVDSVVAVPRGQPTTRRSDCSRSRRSRKT
jgi:hypothetical protein